MSVGEMFTSKIFKRALLSLGSALNEQQIKDAVKFFGLIDQISAHPSGEKLDPVLFRTDG